MTKTELRKTINDAWLTFIRVAGNYGDMGGVSVETCLLAAQEQERGHRRHMRNMGGGYRLSVADTARLFVLQRTYRAMAKPQSWLDTIGLTRESILCAAMREQLARDGKLDAAFPSVLANAIMAIDYAGDVAL